MSSHRLTVKSEIFDYGENSDNVENGANSNKVDAVTYFKFRRPDINGVNLASGTNFDNGLQKTPVENILKIEHSKCTIIDLVGLQVWRGALLLADFISHFGSALFGGKNVLELGSGVGLASIVAAMYADNVVCTDINIDCILDTIRRNVNHNKHLIRSPIQVEEIDFCNKNWSARMRRLISTTDVILAADVIYDNDLTENFVSTLVKILDTPAKSAYVALEKRYVFTIADLDTVAPCYEYFISYLKSTIEELSLTWNIEYIPLNFPCYFDYVRTKELLLLKITPCC